MAKLSLADLRSLRESKKNELRKREVEGKEIQIIIGMGTCGIAAGAKQTQDAFLDGLVENKLVDTVLVRQLGCLGFCGSEPTVEVLVPGMPETFYGKVDAAVAKEIIQTHIIGKKVLDGRVLDKSARK